MTFAVRFVVSLLFAFVSPVRCCPVCLPKWCVHVLSVSLSLMSLFVVSQLIARYGLNCPLSSCPLPLVCSFLLFVFLLSSHEKYRFPPSLPTLSFLLSTFRVPLFPFLCTIALPTVSISIYLIIYLFICYLSCFSTRNCTIHTISPLPLQQRFKE